MTNFDPMESDFDERLRDYLEQTGMMSELSDEDRASLDAALSAIKIQLSAFPQPFVGDVPPETCRAWLDKLLQIFDDFTFDTRRMRRPRLTSLSWRPGGSRRTGWLTLFAV